MGEITDIIEKAITRAKIAGLTFTYYMNILPKPPEEVASSLTDPQRYAASRKDYWQQQRAILIQKARLYLQLGKHEKADSLYNKSVQFKKVARQFEPENYTEEQHDKTIQAFNRIFIGLTYIHKAEERHPNIFPPG